MAGDRRVRAGCGAPAAHGATPSTPASPTTPLANTPAPAPPIVAAPVGDAVLAWPVAPFTRSQIAEVKSCDIDKLANSRYPKTMTVDALAGAFARHGTCDDATFAAACAGLRTKPPRSRRRASTCIDP